MEVIITHIRHFATKDRSVFISFRYIDKNQNEVKKFLHSEKT